MNPKSLGLESYIIPITTCVHVGTIVNRSMMLKVTICLLEAPMSHTNEITDLFKSVK